jgi:DNA-binding transcriptional regulator YiaG
MKQASVALLLGVGVATLRLWEQDRAVPPPEKRSDVSAFLGFDPFEA